MSHRPLTTRPSARHSGHGWDAGQRGWRLHLVETGREMREARVSEWIRYGNADPIDVSPALCGLRPAWGWGLDLFIEDYCSRCLEIAERRGISTTQPTQEADK